MIINMSYGDYGSSGSSIIVTIDSGSTVYITDESGQRFDAQEENGTWTFEGFDVGTYTITANLGNLNTTENIVIQEQGQLLRYEILMSYFKAYITVTYPIGSTCTCTKGEMTFTASDISGNFTFVAIEAGDWVVSCTDGEKTDTETVTITSNEETKSITLNYWNGELFYNGNTYDDITGGYSLGEWTVGSTLKLVAGGTLDEDASWFEFSTINYIPALKDFGKTKMVLTSNIINNGNKYSSIITKITAIHSDGTTYDLINSQTSGADTYTMNVSTKMKNAPFRLIFLIGMYNYASGTITISDIRFA